MDYLKVDLLGGMYLDAEDWVFNQNGLKKALQGLASLIGSNVYLSGIEPVTYGGGNVTHGEGFVVIEGEVYYIPAATVPDNGALIYIEVEETNDPDGLEAFQDGGAPQNTYIKRTGKVVTYPTFVADTTTRKFWLTMPTLDSKTLEIIQAAANNFSARQSWAQGADFAAVTGSNTLSPTFSGGNSFNCNINAADTEIVRFGSSVQDGTWFALHFTGTTGTTISIKQTTGFTNLINTPDGNTYIFKVGETAVFIKDSGVFKLVNGRASAWLSSFPSWTGSVNVSGVGNKSFKWFIDGKTVHCRFSYTATLSVGGDFDVIFPMPFSIVGAAPQTWNALVATFPDLTSPHFGLCRIGNGSDYTKMVHKINDVSGAGDVLVYGTITFEMA